MKLPTSFEGLFEINNTRTYSEYETIALAVFQAPTVGSLFGLLGLWARQGDCYGMYACMEGCSESRPLSEYEF